MDDFLARLGLSVDDANLVIAAVGVVLAATIAAVPPARRAFLWLLRRWLVLSGFYYRRYRKWLVDQHGEIYNIYLGENERLDLSQAYVPLSFSVDREVGASRLMASEVIANRSNHRILIVGDPGSGKTTLLRAFAVGNLLARRMSRLGFALSRTNQVPILISLRHFARHASNDTSLADYVVDQLLGKEAGLRSAARAFFRSLLNGGRCLILLDGLDEVSSLKYEHVRDQIHIFISDQTRSLATHRAKVVLTCRRQNFLTIQEEWIGAFGGRSYTLAPFRDAEIFRYLEKMRTGFVGDKTPESFMSAIVSSRTTELHRNPLVLAMSAGLYASVPEFEIPSSVALLYRSMVEELLSRQDTRRNPVGSSNRFPVRDKWRFLQSFALTVANRDGRFDDFMKADLLNHSALMAPNLAEVPEAACFEFVQEIINRSGLLSETSDDGTFAFAHRSIHEFLAAEELRRRPAQERNELLRKATDTAWRQTILFFAAATEDAGEFISRLGGRNLELAGHCLADAPVSDEIGVRVCRSIMERISTAADALRDAVEESLRDTADGLHVPNQVERTTSMDGGRSVQVASAKIKRRRERATRARAAFARRLDVLLPALLAATKSPQPTVQEEALGMVRDIVIAQFSTDESWDVNSKNRVGGLLSGDVQAALNVVNALASIGGDEMATLAAEVARALSKDSRLVEPLWRLLARPSISDSPRKLLVGRLLSLIMEPDCLLELERQLPYDRERWTNREREEAYPFRKGYGVRSNLVTLLTYADTLDASPVESCVFFQAKTQDRRAFRRVEKDRHRTFRISFRLGTALRVASRAGPVIAVSLIGVVIALRPSLFTQPFGAGNVVLLLAPPLVTTLAYSALKRIEDLELSDDDYITNIGCVGSGIALSVYAIALLPLASVSVAVYVFAGAVVGYGLYVIPATRLRDRHVEVFFPRRNPFLKIYSDPRCRHWVLPFDKRVSSSGLVRP